MSADMGVPGGDTGGSLAWRGGSPPVDLAMPRSGQAPATAANIARAAVRFAQMPTTPV